MQNTKYTLKNWGVCILPIGFNLMFCSSHFNMSTVLQFTRQHGIPGNKIKPIFSFPKFNTNLRNHLQVFHSKCKKQGHYMEGQILLIFKNSF